MTNAGEEKRKEMQAGSTSAHAPTTWEGRIEDWRYYIIFRTCSNCLIQGHSYETYGEQARPLIQCPRCGLLNWRPLKGK